MTSPDQTSTDEPVAMRSGSSGYADINSVRPHLEINPAVRQMSYYEAVRGNTEVASPVSSMGNNSSSTVNLVEDLTCPKDMHNYQIRQHRMYPPIIEEEDPREKVDSKSKRISRIVYLLLVAICVISVSLSIFCSVLTINMQKKIDDLEKKVGHRTPTSSPQESKPAASSMCVPCDDIKQGPFEEDNKQLATLDKRFENGLEICCATGSEQVATLLDLVSIL